MERSTFFFSGLCWVGVRVSGRGEGQTDRVEGTDGLSLEDFEGKERAWEVEWMGITGGADEQHLAVLATACENEG